MLVVHLEDARPRSPWFDETVEAPGLLCARACKRPALMSCQVPGTACFLYVVAHCLFVLLCLHTHPPIASAHRTRNPPTGLGIGIAAPHARRIISLRKHGKHPAVSCMLSTSAQRAVRCRSLNRPYIIRASGRLPELPLGPSSASATLLGFSLSPRALSPGHWPCGTRITPPTLPAYLHPAKCCPHPTDAFALAPPRFAAACHELAVLPAHNNTAELDCCCVEPPHVSSAQLAAFNTLPMQACVHRCCDDWAPMDVATTRVGVTRPAYLVRSHNCQPAWATRCSQRCSTAASSCRCPPGGLGPSRRRTLYCVPKAPGNAGICSITPIVVPIRIHASPTPPHPTP